LKKPPKIIKRINSAIALPSLPQVFFKLVEVCKDASSTEKDIAEMAALDPSISLRLLRLVNTNTLEKAVAALGPNIIKNIAVTASLRRATNPLLKNSSFNFNQFWFHSVQCGIIARTLAREVHYDYPEDAYLAGLLHDIGKLVLWANFSRDYVPIVEGMRITEEVLIAEKKKIGATHCEIGWSLINPLGLHPFVADAILYHHWPAKEIANAFTLVKIVYAANAVWGRETSTSAHFSALEKLDLELDHAQIEKITRKARSDTDTIIRTLGLTSSDISGPPEIETVKSEFPSKKMSLEIREMSMIHGAASNLISAIGREAIQKELLFMLQIHFEIRRALFFYYDTANNVLLANPTTGTALDHAVVGVQLPVREDGSFPSLALLNEEIVDSFGYLTDQLLTIADEQLIRILNTEGILCIPLISRQKYIGVIVAGTDEAQFPQLSEQLALLKKFADHAALFLGECSPGGNSSLDRDKSINRIETESMRKIIHEVKNPLGIIKNYLKILGSRLDENPTAVNDITVIGEEIERVSRIIEQLSKPGRPTDRDLEGVDINDVIRNLSTMFKKSELEPSNINLYQKLDPSLPLFPGNRNSLIQVFINLLKNSVEAMPQGGNVFIETVYERHMDKNAAGNIVITIRDDGPGIPAHIMERLFEPGTSSKGPENFGLGLSISRDIINNYNGRITCKSRKREGTILRISLPVSDYDAP
jgi:signal transduction histidine kinase/HD-like signal output (HDOD) protein